jgi:4-amino-4-deoxy-L-arabinose transferase-like glycosyltransferase
MKPRYQLLALVAVAACLFFIGLGRLPLLEPDEGRNAEVAREMISLDDWITPHYDTLPYLDKPAVLFWLVAGSFKVFGLSETAARLPSALAALGTLLLIWLLARRMFDERSAWIAGIIFATSPLVMVFARVVIFDMTLAFFVTLALAAFWLSSTAEPPRRDLDCLMFAAAGVATITKGPVGFILPLLTILVYAAVQGRFSEMKRLGWPPGIALFLAVSLPWFIAVSLRNPDFPRYAFWEESVLRFTTAHAHRGGSVFYYIPVFLAGLLPWSFALLFAGVNRVRGWKRLRESDSAPHAFLLAWALVTFVFFSISHSKLPAYFLPAVPALALLMGDIWNRDVKAHASGRRPDWLTAAFAVLIAIGILTAALPPWLQSPSMHRVMVRKIHPDVLAQLPSSIFYSGLIIAALGILGRNLVSRSRERVYAVGSLAILACTVPLLAVRWWGPIESYARTSSTQRLASAVLHGSDRDLAVYGYYYFRTGLPFYLRRPVGLVTSEGGEFTSNYIAAHWPAIRAKAAATSSTSFRPASGLFLDANDFAALGRASPEPFLVIVQNDEVPDVDTLASPLLPLWQAWAYSVWKATGSRALRAPNP